MIREVRLSKRAKKDLKGIPRNIVRKLGNWIREVEIVGLEEVRKISGYHDESLRGRRRGQRSIRLNRSYRAIYTIRGSLVEFVMIEEVNKHEY